MDKKKALEEYKGIFSREFMIEYTDFDNIEDLFYFGGIEVKSLEDYSIVDLWMVDDVVERLTGFKGLKEFIAAARQGEI